MSTAEAGRVVLALTEKGPVAGVLVESRGGRVTVVTSEGSRETWAGERVFLTTSVKVPIHPPQAAISGLATFLAKLQMMAGSADQAGAWDILSDGGAVTPLSDLADLMFGASEAEQQAAAAWVFESDPTWFKRRREGQYAPNSVQAVESTIRARLREQQEVERMEQVRAALAGLLDAGLKADMSDSAVAAGIGWLSALVYDGPEGRDGKRGLRLVSALRGGVAPSEPDVCAFDFLVRLGAADPDEILSIRRNRIPVAFDQAVEAEAERVAGEVRAVPGAAPLKWTEGFGPLAIDDETTRDVDDALMAEPVDGATRVHILVADPSSSIGMDSVVGQAGMARASSLYIPTGTVPMFPKSLSEGALSLAAGADRPMIDFAVTLADDGTEIDFSITPVWGRIEARVTYDAADAILGDGTASCVCGDGVVPADGQAGQPVYAGSIQKLDALAAVLQKRRVADGAVVLDRDEYSVKIVDGRPTVKRILNTSRARRLVAEFMILAGALAGRFARQNSIPVVYRRQDPPDGTPEDRLKGIPAGSRAMSYTMLRTLKRGELTTIPGFHYSLGVVGYTQVTSPLRRFQDFLAHVQIKGFLKNGRAPMDQDSLMTIFGELEARSEIVTKVEREARRYWTLKYLQGMQGGQVAGEVVSRIGNRVLVELEDTGLVLPLSGAGNVQPGSRVRLAIREVDPRRDHVTLTLA